jgi:hypothetical protein
MSKEVSHCWQIAKTGNRNIGIISSILAMLRFCKLTACRVKRDINSEKMAI